jgi:hydroxyacylglutathione hydrolase
MIVKQIWTANAYRNFNYLIACSETGEALAIDPLDHEKCLGAAKEEGWNITQILNITELIALIRAERRHGPENPRRFWHKNAGIRLRHGPRFERGRCRRKTVEPSWTRRHAMSRVPVVDTDQPAPFCGDTLFNAGAGNCQRRSPDELYKTFDQQLAAAAIDIDLSGPRLHGKQSRFTLNREPDNAGARKMLQTRRPDPNSAYVSTLSRSEINTFFA